MVWRNIPGPVGLIAFFSIIITLEAKHRRPSFCSLTSPLTYSSPKSPFTKPQIPFSLFISFKPIICYFDVSFLPRTSTARVRASSSSTLPNLWFLISDVSLIPWTSSVRVWASSSHRCGMLGALMKLISCCLKPFDGSVDVGRKGRESLLWFRDLSQ